jgi:hypothetical protein
VITFVDTSIILKVLIGEVGTAEAGRIWDEPHALVAARVGHVEARAALDAARRQGRISADVFRKPSRDSKLFGRRCPSWRSTTT